MREQRLETFSSRHKPCVRDENFFGQGLEPLEEWPPFPVEQVRPALHRSVWMSLRDLSTLTVRCGAGDSERSQCNYAENGVGVHLCLSAEHSGGVHRKSSGSTPRGRPCRIVRCHSLKARPLL